MCSKLFKITLLGKWRSMYLVILGNHKCQIWQFTVKRYATIHSARLLLIPQIIKSDVNCPPDLSVRTYLYNKILYYIFFT